jgi:ABC-type sugar transport system permease subunit
MSDWLPKSPAGRRWLGLAPSYIVIGIFMLIPMVIMAVFSFLEPNPYGGVKPVGSWAAYIKIAFEYDLEDKLVFNPGYLAVLSVVLRRDTVVPYFWFPGRLLHYASAGEPS